MSIGSAIPTQRVHANHRENCSTQHHMHVVAAADSHSQPSITEDHLGLSSARRLQVVPYKRRERSHSASDGRSTSPTQMSSSSVARYLSPDYGVTSPGRPSTAQRRVTRRGGNPDSGIAVTKNSNSPGATIKRSSSATLAVDSGDSRRIPSTSSFGSGLHLGSSVTFCNTFGRPGDIPSNTTDVEHHELFFSDDSSRPRRSCSITLAYPSHRRQTSRAVLL